jgi:hypothetical protein
MAVLEDAERARWQLENEVSDATAAIAASSEEPVTRVTL